MAFETAELIGPFIPEGFSLGKAVVTSTAVYVTDTNGTLYAYTVS